MFGFGKKNCGVTKSTLKQLEHEHQLEISKLKSDHSLELKEKEFELRHFKDEEVKSLKDKLAEKEKAMAVLQKENNMLEKITDLNADIVDIKDLVNKLIEKLPTINLQSLSLGNGDKSK